MTASIYISYAADLAAVVLMIIQMFRLRKLPSEKSTVIRYFRRFSLMVLIMSAVHLLQSYADMELGVYSWADFQRLSSADQTAIIWMETGAGLIDIFLSTLFLYMWITFLCLYLFDDKDYLRRKFMAGFTPLIIATAVTAVCTPLAVLSDAGFWIYVVAVCVFFAIRIYYFFIGFRLLREYKIQNGYLRFFNPWVFFIPVFAGWILQDLFSLGFSALGCTLGLMLLYSSITSELRYIDRSTGFYNMDFVVYLKGLIAKKQYAPSSVMTFTLDSPEKMKEFSEILKKQLPKDCEPIVHNDHEIVVLTNVKEKGALAMVIEDVKAVTEVKAACKLKKKAETETEFMERIL